MLKLIFSIAVIAGALGAGGCALTPCKNDLGYRDAKTHELPVIPDGLKALSPDPSYKIPKGRVSETGPETPSQCVIFPPEVVNPDNPQKKAG